jgi:hypothetical protein
MEQAERPERSERLVRAAPRPAADPFFEKPYEPSTASGSSPAWETAKAATPTSAPRALSPNIRPKRKVASLLGGNR